MNKVVKGCSQSGIWRRGRRGLFKKSKSEGCIYTGAKIRRGNGENSRRLGREENKRGGGGWDKSCEEKEENRRERREEEEVVRKNVYLCAGYSNRDRCTCRDG
ncbi:MAG: hypothetical protein LBT73_03080 [Tannerellaceae bacterium]|nr:hypothetical protein [Tannerellaceae bacterium]